MDEKINETKRRTIIRPGHKKGGNKRKREECREMG